MRKLNMKEAAALLNFGRKVFLEGGGESYCISKVGEKFESDLLEHKYNLAKEIIRDSLDLLYEQKDIEGEFYSYWEYKFMIERNYFDGIFKKLEKVIEAETIKEALNELENYMFNVFKEDRNIQSISYKDKKEIEFKRSYSPEDLEEEFLTIEEAIETLKEGQPIEIKGINESFEIHQKMMDYVDQDIYYYQSSPYNGRYISPSFLIDEIIKLLSRTGKHIAIKKVQN